MKIYVYFACNIKNIYKNQNKFNIQDDILKSKNPIVYILSFLNIKDKKMNTVNSKSEISRINLRYSFSQII